MRIFDILSMCVRSLFKRKLRTVLTMLGVVIGTVAIVTTVSLGLALNIRFDQQLSQMGDLRLIRVTSPGNMWRPSTDDAQGPDLPSLDIHAARAFAAIPGVASVSPQIETQLSVRSGRHIMANSFIIGVYPELMAEDDLTLAAGRLLQAGDTTQAVFSSNAEMLFDPEPDGTAMWGFWFGRRFWDSLWAQNNPEAETEPPQPLVDIFNDPIFISHDRNFIWGNQQQEEDVDLWEITTTRLIQPIEIEVVGLLEFKENMYMENGYIYMDIDTVQRLRMEQSRLEQQQNAEWGWIDARQNAHTFSEYSYILVRASNINHVANIHSEITQMGFPASHPGQSLEQIQGMARSQQQMLGAIGAVSLFVAAIGIANTMVMSIYERTREIGVMKVIGATVPDIRKMFLIEASLIGLLGGIIGVGLSYGASYILNNAAQFEGFDIFGGMFDWIGDPNALVSYIAPWLAVLAIIFATIIGLVSGYLPAQRATKLSALTAIRTD